MIGIPLGLLYANASEWVVHKYILHGLGKNPNSFWAFHWHEHHRAARRHQHVDDAYRGSPFRANAQGKELAALVGSAALLAPIFPIAPFFVGTVWYSAANYYRRHKRAHLDPAWAKQHLPWHYDHHMGPEQDANWCVTRPWFDWIMGTRVPYLGSERAERDDARRAARAARASAASVGA